jgi:hypothetical protein
MSARETAIQALQAAIAAAVAPVQVVRDATRPEKLPAAGLVLLRTGETQSAEAMMSPLQYAVEHQAEMIAWYSDADPTARAEAIDDMLTAVVAALASNRTLGGAVEWAQPGSPAAEVDDTEGTTPVGAMSLPITLYFTAAESPAG